MTTEQRVLIVAINLGMLFLHNLGGYLAAFGTLCLFGLWDELRGRRRA